MVESGGKNIEVEIAIRTSRILKVLDETIEKIDLVLYLPVFLKNLNKFTNRLSKDELIVLSTCEIYQSQDASDEETNTENEHFHEPKVSFSQSFQKETQLTTKERCTQNFSLEYEKPNTNGVEDPNIKKAIYILWKHSDMVHSHMDDYLKPASRSIGRLIFLENMRALRQCAYARMTEDLSPEAEINKALNHKEIWNKNDDAKAKINALKPQLNDIQMLAQVETEEKNKIITDMNDRMKTLENEFKEEVEKICNDSEGKMSVEIINSEERQKVISSDIRNLEETYKNTLHEHLKQEKELREKRFMIENQLEECLEAYDNDMGELQAEYEEILAEYEDEQYLLTSLQEKFLEQEKEYIILMEEKAYEEHLELERRIEDLRRRIAARTIQIHWRALKQRRLERAKSKKARKGKGGKKKGGEKAKS